ncbi:MAG: hypothetical protein Q8L37_05370 [Candidatus Gottesmanbacteria bacterium]|nr:hypothetical protein [Candidatus Gottesmanbacteria bacterium]
MNTVTLAKTDFIKFNVSPTFKALARKKAATHGMSLSELGRMLFGAFTTETISGTSQFSKQFLALAEEARADHRKGKGVLLKSPKDISRYFESVPS